MMFVVNRMVTLVLTSLASSGSALHDVCFLERCLLHLPCYESQLLEVHIACGVTAAVVHRPRVLRVLERVLWYLWPASVLLTLVDMATSELREYAHPAMGIHFLTCTGHNVAFLSAVMGLYFGVVSLLYVVAVVWSCKIMGDAAMQRTIRRAVFFPLSFFFSFGIYGLAQWPGMPVDSKKWWEVAAAFAVTCNGFTNAVTYGALEPWRHSQDLVVGFAHLSSTVEV